jgi:hypothetical protein
MTRNVSRSRRARGDDGTALVEFAFVMVLLFMLVYGIIAFGLLLSFKQNLVQSAAEGARAGAVAPNPTPKEVKPRDYANAAITKSLSAYDRSCAAPLTCNVTFADCPITGVSPSPRCITVEIVFDYAHDPFLPDLPLISAFLPDTIRASSTAQLNP